MRVLVDKDQCVASGLCASTAPQVFDQDDDGSVVVLQEHPGAELYAAVHVAIRGCSAAAIWIEEDE